MRNTMKVAKWEIKRNMKNKTFLIGLFLTPLLIIGFFVIGSLFDDSSDKEQTVELYVIDEIGLLPAVEETISMAGFDWEVEETDLSQDAVRSELEETENTAYLFLTAQGLNEGIFPVYMSEEMPPYFLEQLQILETPIKSVQLAEQGLTAEEMAIVSAPILFEQQAAEDEAKSEESRLERVVPGAFAGFIMLSIVFTGMAIFQSASQEKKDKIAEILLSSLTPADLMQGKIIGYFVLGIIQTVISLVIILPVAIWRFELQDAAKYLLAPELLFYILIACMGYLLFSAIFVGIGATMSDMTTAGNFQGFVMMLPFLPFLFIGPVVNDPSGLWAQVGTYIPFTTPGVLLLRLTILEEWPWIEIAIGLAILAVSIWIFMKLAGKIFKVGILMYGKNATPGEIWKWIRA